MKKIKVVFLFLVISLFVISCGCGLNFNDADVDKSEDENSMEDKTDISKDNDEISEKLDESNIPQMTEEEKKAVEEKERIAKEEEEKKIELERQEKLVSDREELEKSRVEKYGEFYVPLLPLDTEKTKNKIDVKALYATGFTACMAYDQSKIDEYAKYVKSLEANMRDGSSVLPEPSVNKWEKIIALAKSTEINSIVFDVKDDYGSVTYKSDVDIINQANERYKIADLKEVIEFLHDNGIYTIARIVTFKDKNFAEKFPDHCIQKKTGGVWYDPYNGNVAWVNPYDKYVWDYDLSVAKEVSLMGFDEINFDYIRFPDNAKHYNSIVNFGETNGKTKDEAISDFLAYTKSELEPYHVNISCDVFGIVTRTWEDYPDNIGQTWIKMADDVDYVCPMSYPSHYGPGWYGLDNPNANPYAVIRGSTSEALEKSAALENSAKTRPWIQGFSWAGIDYGPKMIRDQIIAAKELGVDEYLIWSASNYYNPRAYIPTNEEVEATYPEDLGDNDYAFRNPSEALKHYLAGMYYKRYSWVYLLTMVENRPESYDDFEHNIIESGEKYTDFDVYDYSIDENNKDIAYVELDYILDTGKKDEDGKNVIKSEKKVKWTLIKENGIWKLKTK